MRWRTIGMRPTKTHDGGGHGRVPQAQRSPWPQERRAGAEPWGRRAQALALEIGRTEAELDFAVCGGALTKEQLRLKLGLLTRELEQLRQAELGE